MTVNKPIKITLVYLEGGLRAETKGDNANKIKSAKSKWLTLDGLKGESKVNVLVAGIRMFEVVDAQVTETPVGPPATGEFRPVVL